MLPKMLASSEDSSPLRSPWLQELQEILEIIRRHTHSINVKEIGISNCLLGVYMYIYIYIHIYMYIHNHTHIISYYHHYDSSTPSYIITYRCMYLPTLAKKKTKQNIRIQPTATGYRIEHQLWNQQTYSGWWLMMVNIHMVNDGYIMMVNDNLVGGAITILKNDGLRQWEG